MLNELLVMRRGMEAAGIEMLERPRDVQEAGTKATLRVALGPDGEVVGVDAVPSELSLWTFGKGNKKRFPFVQPTGILLHRDWTIERKERWLTAYRKRRGEARRRAFLAFLGKAELDSKTLDGWPGRRARSGKWSEAPGDYLKHLGERVEQLQPLHDGPGEAVVAALLRFRSACDNQQYGLPLLHQVVTHVSAAIRHSADDRLLEVAESLLLFGGGAFYIDVPVAEFQRLASDPNQVAEVSRALTEQPAKSARGGTCALSGGRAPLVKDKFPGPVVPVVSKTILFQRFRPIPANARYGRFEADAFPVSQTVANGLAAVLRELTRPERKDKTWRRIPRESPKQIGPKKVTDDLLLSFVEAVPEAEVAAVLAEEFDEASYEDAGAEDQSGDRPSAGSIAAFEAQAERIIEAVRAKVAHLAQTPVRFAVLRQLDPGNRKVVYGGEISVRHLDEAASAWGDGQRNLPPWLTLPMVAAGERAPRPTPPPHVAPLGLIAFSQAIYLYGCCDKMGKIDDIRRTGVGIPAAEAFALFLDHERDDRRRRRAERVLRLVLARRAALAGGMVHALRKGGLDHVKKHDPMQELRHETLRTATVLGVLVHKLGSEKECYMNDAPFRLGQLLAAADQIHAGYCADRRDGDVPPSLLGNQVFSIAGKSPAKALSMLQSRWKPYIGWAKEAARDQGEATLRKADALTSSKKTAERTRGWDIRKGLSYARRLEPLAADLWPRLVDAKATDKFRAELLLGYMAGLESSQRDDRPDKHSDGENQDD